MVPESEEGEAVDRRVGVTAGRTWRSVLLAPVGDGQRGRRGSDGLRLAAATVAVAACLLLIRANSRVDRAIAEVLHPPPRSITWLVTVVYDVGSLGVIAALVVVAVVARRRDIARDVVASVVGTAAVTGALTFFLGGAGGRPGDVVVAGYALRFPVLQVAAAMAVVTAVLPYLARSVQRTVELLVVLVALAAAVGGHGLPVNVLGSLAIGWGVTAAVHLALGSPLGLPSVADVGDLLAGLGIDADGLVPRTRQVWGVARYRACDRVVAARAGDAAAGLNVDVYGRDAADAKFLTKAGRVLLYRDSGPSLTLTRLQQVEHQAYLTLRAERAGVRVGDVVEAGLAGPAGDALVVSRRPPGAALADFAVPAEPLPGDGTTPGGGAGGEAAAPPRRDGAEVRDGAADDLFHQLALLRAARLVHGSVSGDSVIVAPDGRSVALVDFRNAASNATDDQLDRDQAGALAALALAVGPERAAAAAARNLSTERLAAALQRLRRAGLDADLAHALKATRGSKALLEEVRRRAAETGGIEVPKLAEPLRVSVPTLVMLLGTLIGGWALIGVLIDVSKSFDTVVGADWLWVAVAFVLSQAAYIASAFEALGSVAGPLPLGQTVAVEVANAFSALAGGTPAVFATRVRFFQQQGYDATVALSSGAIMTTASWLAITVLFLASLPFAWGAINLEATPQSGGDARLVWVILAVVVLVGVVVGVALAVPRLRRLASDALRPKVRDIWGNLARVAATPSKLVQLVAGAFAGELLVAMALSVALRAFGDHVNLPTLLVVITFAGIVGGVSPSPGGMGVVEAGMILGLTAVGVSEADATAAVFIQRLFTSYLPPLWGWFALVWMRRREYL